MIEQKPIISFLIGSGFSIPCNLPSVKMINDFFLNINENDYNFNLDLSVNILRKPDVSLYQPRLESKILFKDFINFYCKKINIKYFDYEEFYDFLCDYIYHNKRSKIINDFYNTFIQDYPNEFIQDCKNQINNLKTIFLQIITEKLSKKDFFDDRCYSTYPPYESFIDFLNRISKIYEIKIHTLNHDLLLDHICFKTNKLFNKTTDGFNILGSNIFGKLESDINNIYRIFHIRFPIFQNIYDKEISLYKLHGSIGNYKIFSNNSNYERIRIKSINTNVDKLYCDFINNNTISEKNLIQEIYPDFLTGKTQKIKEYNDEYYQILFNHFKGNLENSKLLIVIGYGFKDKGINDYIFEYYPRGYKILIFDVEEKKEDWFTNYKIKQYFEKSFVKYTDEELKHLLNFSKN